MLEVYLSLLEQGYYEVKFAFEGLADENVWKRPAPGLLSVGELAGHIAYWEAVRLAGEGGDLAEHITPDLTKCRVSSPLIDHRFAYYPKTITTPPSEQHQTMTAEQVCNELLRVHEEAVAHFKALNPDPESNPPGWSSDWTYRSFLEYLTFHIAYHTGQMYSVRHLLGENTPDN
jgi:hypothetical protein